MADESANAEEKAQQIATDSTSVAQTGTEQAGETQGGGEEGKRPGGSGPLDVQARKMWDEAKRAREEARQEREARIAAESEAKALREQASKPQEKRPTIQQVQAAMDAGTVSLAEGTSYIAQVKAEELYEARERQKEQYEAALRPLQKAETEISSYLQLAPYLRDDNDERTQAIGIRYQSLIRDYGLAPNNITKALAIRESLGPLDQLAKQREIANLTSRGTATYAGMPAGGTNTNSQTTDLSKAPASMVAYWDRTNTPEAARKKEFEIWKQLKEQRK